MITFRTASIPKYIKIGYLRIPVELYIPNPLRCFNCQKFGHGKKTCKGKEICAKCGQAGHSGSPCNSETKCPNCAGGHTAFSKECPKWLFEKKVQKLKAENSISFAEARKAAAGENESRPSHDTRTAAEVVRPRSKPPPPATRSIKIQTDLTWPNDQESPTMAPTQHTPLRLSIQRIQSTAKLHHRFPLRWHLPLLQNQTLRKDQTGGTKRGSVHSAQDLPPPLLVPVLGKQTNLLPQKENTVLTRHEK